VAENDEQNTTVDLDALVAEKVAEATAGLKASRDELLREKKQLAARLKAIPDDFDPEQYAALKAQQEALAVEKAKAAGDFEAIKRQLVERHAADLEKANQRAERLRGTLEARMVDAELTTAIARAKGVPELLLPHVRRAVKIDWEADEPHAYVANKKGEPRVGDERGTPMSFDQLVEEYRQDPVFARAFEGTGSSGSGASGSNGGGGAVRQIKRNDPRAIGLYAEELSAGKAKLVD